MAMGAHHMAMRPLSSPPTGFPFTQRWEHPRGHQDPTPWRWGPCPFPASKTPPRGPEPPMCGHEDCTTWPRGPRGDPIAWP